jgi:hypothetical protein
MARTPLSSTPSASREAAPKALAEHSLVTLSSEARLEDGRLLPCGSAGAIVGIWRDGAAYEVEFSEPFHAVVTVSASKLDAA